jgi:pimeloyl-ACP methyl ester carboxylesterase
VRLSPAARRRLLLAVILLSTLLATGAVYQTIAERAEKTRFPPPGRLVDIGGRRLHLVCLGRGEPTVVFEASMFGNAVSAERARAAIAAEARVCSYDRAGMGWSDPGSPVLSAGDLAADLDRLLARAGIQPPVIVVASSIGGLTAELFARRHPDEVAGLVMLDAANSVLLDRLEATYSSAAKRAATMAACLPKIAARFGLLRIGDPMHLRAQRANQSIALLYRPEPMDTTCAMVRGARRTLDEFHAAPPLPPDLPLDVLSAETTEGLSPLGGTSIPAGLASMRVPTQQAFAARSSRGLWRLVPGSSHLIATSQPDAVSRAVSEMLASLRGRGRLAPTARRPRP